MFAPPGDYDYKVFPDIVDDISIAEAVTTQWRAHRAEVGERGGFDGGPFSCALEVAEERAGLPKEGIMLSSAQIRALIERLEAAQVREACRKTSPTP